MAATELSRPRLSTSDGTIEAGRRLELTTRYNVLLSWDGEQEVWVAYVPTLNWLSTFGSTRGEAFEQAREAVLGYMEAATREGLEVPAGDGEAEFTAIEVAMP